MENAGYAATRFDTHFFQKGHGVAITSVLYKVTLILVIILASQGPAILQRKTAELVTRPLQTGVRNQTIFESPVTHAQQILHFGERLKNPAPGTSFSFKQVHDITLFGSTAPGETLGWLGCNYGCVSCPEHEYCTTVVGAAARSRTIRCSAKREYCSGVPLASVDYLEYRSFQLLTTVHAAPELSSFSELRYEYTTTSVNPNYTTKWEIPWKYAFLSITLLIMLTPKWGTLARIVASKRVPTRQQCWALVLLTLLCWYNDPLIAAQVYAPRRGPQLLALHAIMQSVFLAALLLHWLELFSLMSGTSSSSRGFNGAASSSFEQGAPASSSSSSRSKLAACWRVAPWCKVAVVGTILVTNALLFALIKLRQEIDASFAAQDLPGRRALMGIALLALLVYALWLLVVLCKSLRRFLGLSRPYKFLFLLSVWTMALMVTGLVAGAAAPSKATSGLWLSWRALPNLYVWIYAYGYTPAAGAAAEAKRDLATGAEVHMGRRSASFDGVEPAVV